MRAGEQPKVRPPHRAPRARAVPDAPGLIVAARRSVALRRRLLRRETLLFRLGLQRLAWMLPLLALVLVSSWITRVVGSYQWLAAWMDRADLAWLILLLAQALLLVLLHRAAGSTWRVMTFPGTRGLMTGRTP